MEDWISRLLYLLESLSKNDYALLPKSKVERTFIQILDRLTGSTEEGLINEAKRLVIGFDALSIEEKIERIHLLRGLFSRERGDTFRYQIKEEPLDLEVYRKNRQILSTPLLQLRGIGPRIYKKLEKRGIKTIEDALFFLPRGYEDRRSVTPIGSLKEGQRAVVFGEIMKSGVNHYSRKKTFEVLLHDGTGFLVLKWFNFKENVWRGLYKTGKRIYAIGEVKRFLKTFEMHHPETIDEDDNEKIETEIGAILPVYPSIENFSERSLRKMFQDIVKEYLQALDNFVPVEILKKNRLLPVKEALRVLHLPPEDVDFKELTSEDNIYLRSLAFEELFFLELGLALRKSRLAHEKGIAYRVESKLVEDFLSRLPFELTRDQKRVIEEIKRDMAKETPMNRLLQGDVGCGKTVVAFVSALIAIDNGYQVALMAPTEILAEQHYRNFRQYAQLMGINSALLTGGILPSRKREIKLGLSTGYIQFVIGTHALFQDDVEFKKLGLVIIDEQHRFGVLQRASLREKAKGIIPDTLVMTATPIPRTLALTVYGDLDLSIIREMPRGRKPVITRLFTEANKRIAYEELKKELRAGNQGYIILPLIEESETSDLKAVLSYGEELKNTVLRDFKAGILHGKMNSSEKERIMREFKNGSLQVLISTTVVEVGVDVPRATVMIIEHAERFGLSQLHQLRGRVGRSERQSYCFLIAYKVSPNSDAYRRLQVLCQTNDGFKIAEADLQLRGPGDIFGTQQSGFLEFRRADPVRDLDLLIRAKESAFELIRKSPDLRDYPVLREELFRRWEEKLKLSEVA